MALHGRDPSEEEALFYNAEFIMTMHNLGQTESDLSDLSDLKMLSRESIFRQKCSIERAFLLSLRKITNYGEFNTYLAKVNQCCSNEHIQISL